MVKIYSLNIYEIMSNIKIDKLLSFVSKEKVKKIKSYLKLSDAYRSLLGEILIRFIISKNFNLEYFKIHFIYNKFGKPLIKNFDNFNFNIWGCLKTWGQPLFFYKLFAIIEL